MRAGANEAPSHGVSMCGASRGNTDPGVTVPQAQETQSPQECIPGYLRDGIEHDDKIMNCDLGKRERSPVSSLHWQSKMALAKLKC